MRLAALTGGVRSQAPIARAVRGNARRALIIAVGAGIVSSAAHAARLPARAPEHGREKACADAPAANVIAVSLVDGRVAGRESTIRVKRGDTIELVWTSDRAISLHLHGYDAKIAVLPHRSASMLLRADIAGRFPISEHPHGAGHERAVAYLEVLP